MASTSSPTDPSSNSSAPPPPHKAGEHVDDGNQVWVSVHKRPSLYVDIALRMLKLHDTVELRGLGAGHSIPPPHHAPRPCTIPFSRPPSRLSFPPLPHHTPQPTLPSLHSPCLCPAPLSPSVCNPFHPSPVFPPAALAATIEVASQLMFVGRAALVSIRTATSASKPELVVVMRRVAGGAAGGAGGEHNEDEEALIQLTEDTQMHTGTGE